MWGTRLSNLACYLELFDFVYKLLRLNFISTTTLIIFAAMQFKVETYLRVLYCITLR